MQAASTSWEPQAASKHMGTSVPQQHVTEFCQHPEVSMEADSPLELPDKSSGQLTPWLQPRETWSRETSQTHPDLRAAELWDSVFMSR